MKIVILYPGWALYCHCWTLPAKYFITRQPGNKTTLCPLSYKVGLLPGMWVVSVKSNDLHAMKYFLSHNIQGLNKLKK